MTSRMSRRCSGSSSAEKYARRRDFIAGLETRTWPIDKQCTLRALVDHAANENMTRTVSFEPPPVPERVVGLTNGSSHWFRTRFLSSRKARRGHAGECSDDDAKKVHGRNPESGALPRLSLNACSAGICRSLSDQIIATAASGSRRWLVERRRVGPGSEGSRWRLIRCSAVLASSRSNGRRCPHSSPTKRPAVVPALR